MAKKPIYPGQVKATKVAQGASTKPIAQRKSGVSKKSPQKNAKKLKPIVASPWETESTTFSGAPATVVLSAPTREQPFLVERLLTEAEVAAEYLARQEELDAQFEKASVALKKWGPKLRRTAEFKNHHITGMCLRFRSKFSHTVSPLRVVIAVNVATKFSLDDLKTLNIPELPRSMDEVPVKVLEGGFELIPGSAVQLQGLFTKPKNPIPFTADLVGGVPISPPNLPDAFGTLGVVLQEAAGGWIGVTCQHVAKGSGSRVEQLGPNSAIGAGTSRDIGVVKTAVKKKIAHSVDGDLETVDCASVLLDQTPGIIFPPTSEGWIQGVNQSPPVPLYFSNTRMSAFHKNFHAWKFGSATGEAVTGKIKDTSSLQFDIGNLRYENNFSVVFDRFSVPSLFSTNEFLIPGDSGSIVALEAKVNGARAFVAVGVLFAQLTTNHNVGFACNMRHVIDALQIQVPANRLISSWATL